MTVLTPTATWSLVFCNSCGDVSVDTPVFGWKRYRHRDIDVAVCHHCPTCQEYNELARNGLIHGTPASDAVIYEEWVAP